MKNFTLLGCLLFSLVLSAQSRLPGGKGRSVPMPSSTEIKSVSGSAFLENDFVSGIIRDENGGSQPALMRYYALDDRILIKMDNLEDEVIVLPKVSNLTYEFPDYTYIYKKIKTEDGNNESYYARFYKGPKTEFIGIPRLHVIPEKEIISSYDKARPAKIEVEMDYYISLDGGEFEGIRLKSRDLKNLFKASEIQDFIENNKIKHEKDVIKVLQYFENQSA